MCQISYHPQAGFRASRFKQLPLHMLILPPLGWDFPQLTELVSSWVQQMEQRKVSGTFSPTQSNPSLSVWHQLGGISVITMSRCGWNKSFVRNTDFMEHAFVAQLSWVQNYLETPTLTRHKNFLGSASTPVWSRTPLIPVKWFKYLHSLLHRETKGTTAEGHYLDPLDKKAA